MAGWTVSALDPCPAVGRFLAILVLIRPYCGMGGLFVKSALASRSQPLMWTRSLVCSPQHEVHTNADQTCSAAFHQRLVKDTVKDYLARGGYAVVRKDNS